MVLVVEDEPNVSKTLAWLLQDNGYHTMVSLDAKAALAIAGGIAPDVAIVDIILPDGDGIETALQIQNQVPGCKILLTTGNMEGSERILQARASGIDFHALPKPIPVRELLRVLSELTAPPSGAIV